MIDILIKLLLGLRLVKFDEWIVIFVFLGIFGSIFFWVMIRENNGFNLFFKIMVFIFLFEIVGNFNVGNFNIVFEKLIFSLSIF